MKEIHAEDYQEELFPMGEERAGAHQLLWKIVGFAAVILSVIGAIGAAFA